MCSTEIEKSHINLGEQVNWSKKGDQVIPKVPNFVIGTILVKDQGVSSALIAVCFYTSSPPVFYAHSRNSPC